MFANILIVIAATLVAIYFAVTAVALVQLFSTDDFQVAQTPASL
jgi:hypothetical protein